MSNKTGKEAKQEEIETKQKKRAEIIKTLEKPIETKGKWRCKQCGAMGNGSKCDKCGKIKHPPLSELCPQFQDPFEGMIPRKRKPVEVRRKNRPAFSMPWSRLKQLLDGLKDEKRKK